MRPRHAEGVAFRELSDDETVLVNARGDVAFVLNPMASVIWDLCDGSHSTEEIAAFICDTLPDAELDQVSEDLAALVDKLLEAGLIEDVDACGAPHSDP